mgnify:CR=1
MILGLCGVLAFACALPKTGNAHAKVLIFNIKLVEFIVIRLVDYKSSGDMIVYLYISSSAKAK